MLTKVKVEQCSGVLNKKIGVINMCESITIKLRNKLNNIHVLLKIHYSLSAFKASGSLMIHCRRAFFRAPS